MSSNFLRILCYFPCLGGNNVYDLFIIIIIRIIILGLKHDKVIHISEESQSSSRRLHLTMYQTIGLTDYCWTISGGLTGYRTNGLGLELG